MLFNNKDEEISILLIILKFSSQLIIKDSFSEFNSIKLQELLNWRIILLYEILSINDISFPSSISLLVDMVDDISLK